MPVFVATNGNPDARASRRTIPNPSYRDGETKIPVIYGIDAIHGANYTIGSTIFPQNLAMAATWNRELVTESAKITAMV